jgi:hypothetical protein
MGRICRTYRLMKNAYKILVGKLEGRRSLGRRSEGGKIILKCLLKKSIKRLIDLVAFPCKNHHIQQ